MMNSPLFSILIANYNDGKYLESAINSGLSQTYPNTELIIIDDASSDNSRDVLDKYAHLSNVHIFYDENNMGCGFAKKRCVELAHGDIVGFLDADDGLEPCAVEVMVKTHQEHPEASLCYSRYYDCNEQMIVQGISIHQCQIPQGLSFLEYTRGAISQFATFKKRHYQLTSGMNPKLRISEDLDLYFKLEEVGSTVFIDRPLYYYRKGTGNNSSLQRNIIDSNLWEFVARRDACDRRDLPVEAFAFPILKELIEQNVIKAEYSITSSMTYKVGKYLLHPHMIPVVAARQMSRLVLMSIKKNK